MTALSMWTFGGSAGAHPLGNFTTNTSLTVRFGPEESLVTYVVDLAELPALKVRQGLNGNGNGTGGGDSGGEGDAAALQAWASGECSNLLSRVTLGSRDKVRSANLSQASASFEPGQAGLSTIRLQCSGSVVLALEPGSVVSIDDANYGGRAGWRETVVPGAGTTSVSGAPAVSPTNNLRTYDSELAPLRALHTEVTVQAFDATPGSGAGAIGSIDGGSRTSPTVRSTDRLSTRFQSLLDDRAQSPLLVAGALLIALILGGGHAMAPGHGKSLMAAYVIGRRGGRRDLIVIGSTVALTHTVGVLIFSALALLSGAFAPERTARFTGALSGVLVMGVGLNLLMTRLRRRRLERSPKLHSVDPERWIVTEHSHGGSSHTHVLPKPGTDVSRRELAVMGIAGGMVPSPSALLVLLGAIALDRVGFGLALIVAYGIGLALTLIGAGLLMARLEHTVRRFARADQGGAVAVALSVLPVISACGLIGGGAIFVIRAMQM